MKWPWHKDRELAMVESVHPSTGEVRTIAREEVAQRRAEAEAEFDRIRNAVPEQPPGARKIR